MIDVATLPYNDVLLSLLRSEKAAGRRLVLATAADRGLAEAVAAHLRIFDDVVASNGRRNLKGAEKLRALQERLGGPFDYVGNDASDVEIWRDARAALLVNAPDGVVRAAKAVNPAVTVVERRQSWWRGLIAAMRPHQWSKNLLVFVPMLAGGALAHIEVWVSAITAFLAFSVMASGIYLINDLIDLQADRQHPRKRFRPLASGALPLEIGALASAVLIAGGLVAAWWGGILAFIAAYALVSIAYSLRMKGFPLVDVFVLAFLYTIRLFTGGVAEGYPVSNWLLAVSVFLFLSLAFVKRVTELQGMAGRATGEEARRGYGTEDTAMLSAMGVAAGFSSTLVLALYIHSDMATAQYGTPSLIWLLVPLILFWLCRLWLSTSRGYMLDDPIVYAATDWVSWMVAVSILIVLTAARYFSFAI